MLILGRKFGFTMAEIMIAMTILGVVALLTLPQIIGNTGGRSNKLMIQKSYAVLSQAMKMAYAKMDYDTSEVDRITSYTESGPGAVDVADQKSIENILLKTLDVQKLDDKTHPFTSTKYWKMYRNNTTGVSLLYRADAPSSGTLTVGSASDDHEKGAIFKTREGVYYIFPDKDKIETDGCTLNSPCLAYIDVNGIDSPNTLMACDTDANTGFWNPIAKQYQQRKQDSNADGTPKYEEDGTTPVYVNEAVAACTFDAMNTTDIFAVLIYGGTVVPAANIDEVVLQDHQ